VRERNGEKIYIEKDEFKIGKSKLHADYAIENNNAISRIHVVVLKRNGACFLKDNNSTNGTYIEGRKVQPGEEILLKDEMKVKFGDEEFTFLI
jgi:pSer/pThr/pTyr-binding forkhead associated (FHA) protein